MANEETESLVKVCEALDALSDDAARHRIIQYVATRYGASMPVVGKNATADKRANMQPASRVDNPAEGNEMPGIARLTESGELKLTIRDLKAKSTNDAAKRIAYLAILAAERLTGQSGASSKNVVTPALQEYRAYSGNTRLLLANDKGIVRDGDTLTLDAHARLDAERFLQEVLDPESVGTWRPSSGSTKPRSKKAKTGDE